MNGNIRVGNLFGIPFYVNPSWFLVLGLVTLTYGSDLATFGQLSGILPWGLGFITALLLFASVLAHELGHSLVAIQQGINVRSITLFLFGGLAMLEKESENPAKAFWVAIAGPAVSVALFALFTAINLTVPLPTPLSAIVGLLATINLILAIFNLIPGLPLDGGNILKSIVWKLTGNPYRGVFIASRVGQVVGGLGITIGLLSILGLSQVGSFWTLLIGLFLLQNAGRSAQSATVQEKLSTLSAQDAVTADSPIVSAELSLREFANEYVIGKGSWRKFLATDEQGKLIGAIAVDDLKTVPTSEWTQVLVKDLMQPSKGIRTIDANLSLLDVVMMLEQQDEQQLPVVRDNGELVGLLEKNSIINLLGQGQRKPQPQPVHPA